ncbi:hypothetical protein BJ165DRAFT_1616598 [Panaeolus papilionaceus]|nr:hypothetical protein BJ165DRAFT_1616598 [Panaeolus papilionaceus]
MEEPRALYLNITGNISIKPLSKGKTLPHNAHIYLLMGPTGAGKSSFIEAFAAKSQKLSISRNQLAGYTQNVTAYQLVNVPWVHYGFINQPVYLVDTPGFCDSKISQIEVIEMVRDWLKEHGRTTVRKIIYFTPITDTRLAGSRRRTLEMLKKLLLYQANYNSVILATTMWDTITNEQTRNRAESNFSQLHDEISHGSNVYHPPKRFTNTLASALQLLDVVVQTVDAFSQPGSSADTYLYRDLHERIEGGLQRKAIIEFDLAHDSAQTNKKLKKILKRDQKENDKTLAKFIVQLVEFGDPPNEFREAAQTLRKSIATNIVPKGKEMWVVFQQWAMEPEIRSEPGSNSQVPETKPAEELASNNLVDHRSLRERHGEGLFQCLNKWTRLHRPKWLKDNK